MAKNLNIRITIVGKIQMFEDTFRIERKCDNSDINVYNILRVIQEAKQNFIFIYRMLKICTLENLHGEIEINVAIAKN